MSARTFGASLALALALVCPAAASAQTTTMGSPLAPGPQVGFGCEAAVTENPNDFNSPYILVPSGQPDCTWFQTGVFGDPSSRLTGGAPRDGRVTNVAVRSGPTPAAIRFMILRILAQPGTGTFCCFFVRETGIVRPQPNRVTSFRVNLPMEANTDPDQGIRTSDYIGISGVSGTGALPLRATGRNSPFDFTQPGSVNAGAFWPRLGALPNDRGGGRSEKGLPGFEVLLRWTFCRRGANCGSGSTGATSAGDFLNGSTRDDRICGLAGADTILGGRGNDVLFGDACAGAVSAAAKGDGNDTLDGGPGNDSLTGGGGENSYAAGPGKDTINARNNKKDAVDCGSGKDSATVDKKDTVTGCESVKRG